MIPMSLDAVMKFTDEKDKITYLLKPMTDAAELAIRRVQRNMRALYQPYLAEAEQVVSKEEKAWAVGEKNTAIRTKAMELARNNVGSDDTDAKEIEALNNLLDTVIVGWESQRTDIVPFPPDNKPSKMFNLIAKYEMFSKIMELNNLSEGDVKN